MCPALGVINVKMPIKRKTLFVSKRNRISGGEKMHVNLVPFKSVKSSLKVQLNGKVGLKNLLT